MADDPTLAKLATENKALSDQLRQARADLHLLGVSDQNRALGYAALAGAVGLALGLALGGRVRR